MRKLQVLQNSALRLLYQKPRETPVTTLLHDANQMSVHQLVAFHTATQTYKIYKNHEPKYHFNRLFGNTEDQYRTRSEANLETRIEFKLSQARKSFFYQAAHLWSSLPYQIKTAATTDSFKKSLKPWVRGNISVKP